MVRVFQLMTSVADLVLRGKRDPDQVAEVFQLIKDNPDFAVQLLAKAAADGAVRLFVDYAKPLSEMIQAGHYDYLNPDITEKHFPINKRQNGYVEMKVFYFNQVMESDEVIKEMEEQGYCPAELPEGLAYAKANPDEQRKYPIVILGSVWQRWLGDRLVPCLRGWDGERRLGLDWFGDEWYSYYRFLAVRK